MLMALLAALTYDAGIRLICVTWAGSCLSALFFPFSFHFLLWLLIRMKLLFVQTVCADGMEDSFTVSLGVWGAGFSMLLWQVGWVVVGGGGIIAFSSAFSLAAYGAIAIFMAGPNAAWITTMIVSMPGRPVVNFRGEV